MNIIPLGFSVAKLFVDFIIVIDWLYVNWYNVQVISDTVEFRCVQINLIFE